MRQTTSTNANASIAANASSFAVSNVAFCVVPTRTAAAFAVGSARSRIRAAARSSPALTSLSGHSSLGCSKGDTTLLNGLFASCKRRLASGRRICARLAFSSVLQKSESAIAFSAAEKQLIRRCFAFPANTIVRSRSFNAASTEWPLSLHARHAIAFAISILIAVLACLRTDDLLRAFGRGRATRTVSPLTHVCVRSFVKFALRTAARSPSMKVACNRLPRTLTRLAFDCSAPTLQHVSLLKIVAAFSAISNALQKALFKFVLDFLRQRIKLRFKPFNRHLIL